MVIDAMKHIEISVAMSCKRWHSFSNCMSQSEGSSLTAAQVFKDCGTPSLFPCESCGLTSLHMVLLLQQCHCWRSFFIDHVVINRVDRLSFTPCLISLFERPSFLECLSTTTSQASVLTRTETSSLWKIRMKTEHPCWRHQKRHNLMASTTDSNQFFIALMPLNSFSRLISSLPRERGFGFSCRGFRIKIYVWQSTYRNNAFYDIRPNSMRLRTWYSRVYLTLWDASMAIYYLWDSSRVEFENEMAVIMLPRGGCLKHVQVVMAFDCLWLFMCYRW